MKFTVYLLYNYNLLCTLTKEGRFSLLLCQIAALNSVDV